MSDFPEIDNAVAALVSICPEHSVDGIAVTDLDCGACGSRQEATLTYFSTLLDETIEVLGL